MHFFFACGVLFVCYMGTLLHHTSQNRWDYFFDILRHLSVDCCCFYWIHLLLATRHLWARHQHWTEYRWNQWRKGEVVCFWCECVSLPRSVDKQSLSSGEKEFIVFHAFFLANDDSDQTALSHPSRASVICQNDRACHFDSRCWTRVTRRCVVIVTICWNIWT